MDISVSRKFSKLIKICVAFNLYVLLTSVHNKNLKDLRHHKIFSVHFRCICIPVEHLLKMLCLSAYTHPHHWIVSHTKFCIVSAVTAD
jgi:hypothetical protein